MSNLLLNNKFCAFLIIFINALLISTVVTIANYFGGQQAVAFYYAVYSCLLLGNVVLRYVIKETSITLNRYYTVILVILFILLPILPLIFQWSQLMENSE